MSDTELLHQPNVETVRRVEVFTGSGRRRRWTAEQKARIVAESYAGGDSVCAVARRHGLTQQQLFGWRRAAREKVASEGDEKGLTFAPVIVEVSRSRSEAPIATAHQVAAPMVEIVIGAATVRVPPGIDDETLTTVLRAMRAAG